MKNGERQIGETLSDIRADHRNRYEWAVMRLGDKSKVVIDIGCGVGYGSDILSRAGHDVTGIDIDDEAVDYAKKYWSGGGAKFASNEYHIQNVDTFVAFEVLEHIADPYQLLVDAAKTGSRLLASVPNETLFPYKGPGHEDGYMFHHRHYTPAEFEELLNKAGWEVTTWYGQKDTESYPSENIQGRTIIADCIRKVAPVGGTHTKMKLGRKIAIVAMGISCGAYVTQAAFDGSRKKFVDETWAINNMGSVIEHDLLFHMDDCKVQEARAKEDPNSRVAVMIDWLKTHPKFYTSKVYLGYPGAMEFPLQEVMDEIGGCAYFNSTAAYALGYAMIQKPEEIKLYGYDFSYRNHAKAERGRACVEMLCGIAMANNIKITAPGSSTLFDLSSPNHERFYGYDAYSIEVNGKDISFTPKDIPSAAEIESRYEPGYAQHLRGVK